MVNKQWVVFLSLFLWLLFPESLSLIYPLLRFGILGIIIVFMVLSLILLSLKFLIEKHYGIDSKTDLLSLLLGIDRVLRNGKQKKDLSNLFQEISTASSPEVKREKNIRSELKRTLTASDILNIRAFMVKTPESANRIFSTLLGKPIPEKIWNNLMEKMKNIENFSLDGFADDFFKIFE